MKALAAVLASIPFGFGLIRAVNTGSDVRYVWVALAAMCGGMAGMAAARATGRGADPAVLVPVVFVASGTFAVMAAMVLGTRLGPGILIVAAAFAACFTAASLLSVRARATR